MNHPTNEEWLPYLDGDASAETQARLSAHLEQCPACAAQVAAWRRTIQKLQNLSVPERQAARRPWAQPALKWAIAAAVTLCAGFGLGRLTTPSAATIKSEALAQIRQEIKSDLLTAVTLGGNSPNNDFQKDLRANFENALASAVSRVNADRQQAFQEAMQKVQHNQDESRRALLLLLERIQSQHAADVLALRNDLETAVSTADNDLKLNSRRLTELAATVLAKTNSTQQ